MGAIAEAFVAFAQPLLDQTDGSFEQMNKALSIAQACYNLGQMPEDRREEMIQEMRQCFAMDDAEFDAFRNSIVEPMIRRHEQMFPRMHRMPFSLPMESRPSRQAEPVPATLTKKRRVADPYGPCPCNSGKKYKFCCGRKAR